MDEFNYIMVGNRYYVEGRENNYIVYNLGEYCPELARQYRIMMAHKHDLDRAYACLEQMFFNPDTSLIDDALINTAIQLLVKCFSNPSNKGRKNLDYVKIFRIFAKSIGEDDLTQHFSKFYHARNEVVSHDQAGFNENLIGITIDIDQNIAVDIMDITVRTTYLYKQNQILLKRIISIAQKYVSLQLDQIKQKLIEWYNANDDIITLSPFEIPNDERFNSW